MQRERLTSRENVEPSSLVQGGLTLGAAPEDHSGLREARHHPQKHRRDAVPLPGRSDRHSGDAESDAVRKRGALRHQGAHGVTGSVSADDRSLVRDRIRLVEYDALVDERLNIVPS